MHTLGGPFLPDGGAFEAADSEDECIGCFSLFQFSQNTDAAALEAVLAAADAAGSRGRGGAGSGSEGSSEAGSDDVVLEVNSWWLEHLTVRRRPTHYTELCLGVEIPYCDFLGFVFETLPSYLSFRPALV